MANMPSRFHVHLDLPLWFTCIIAWKRHCSRDVYSMAPRGHAPAYPALCAHRLLPKVTVPRNALPRSAAMPSHITQPTCGATAASVWVTTVHQRSASLVLPVV